MARGKMTAAARLNALADRAWWRGEALIRVDGNKFECFLGAQPKKGRQRLHFRVNGKRVSRSYALTLLSVALWS